MGYSIHSLATQKYIVWPNRYMYTNRILLIFSIPLTGLNFLILEGKSKSGFSVKINPINRYFARIRNRVRRPEEKI